MTVAPAGLEPRAARRAAVHDFKRQAILEAARAVFAENGLDGATVRAVARRAGCAAATVYLYYDGKEEIYAEILGDSLGALAEAVKAGRAAPGAPRARAAAAFLAFLDFYLVRPDALDLGLYLFQGARRRGLTPALDRRLNGRLIAVLQVLADALAAATGLPPERANFHTVSLTSHLIGCAIMHHTGRLAVLGYRARALAEDRLAETLTRGDAGGGP